MKRTLLPAILLCLLAGSPLLAAFQYSRAITISHTKVSTVSQTTLSNFPVAFTGTYSFLATTANGGHVQNANGYDIAFSTDAAGTHILDSELASYNGATGQIEAYVKVPSLSATADTTIYLLYGSSLITAPRNSPNVWAGYSGVWHLNNPGNIPATFTLDSASYELGVKIRSDVSGYITGIRFYKNASDTGTHTGTLWSSSGTQLATGTFTETASGWQQLTFSSPVSIAANTTYIASYHTSGVGHYYQPYFFTNQGYSNGTLHALQSEVDGPNGVYYVGQGSVPNQSYEDANYWTDVLFETGLGGTPFSLYGNATPSVPNIEALDSTAYFNHGLINGVMGGNGQLGGAAAFPTTSQNITVPYSTNGFPTGSQAHTIEAWINVSNFDLSSGGYYSPAAFGSCQQNNMSAIQLAYSSPNISVGWTACGNGAGISSYYNLTSGVWHHIAASYDGANLRFYLDGVLQNTSAVPENLINSFVGMGANGPGNYVGLLDEVRIVNTNVSSDWVATEYANESSPSTFYSVGSETSPTGGGGTGGYVDCAGNYPLVSLSPTSLSWTTQLVNQDAAWHTNLTQPQLVTFQNNGSAPLSIASVALIGTHPSDWYIFANSCTGSIAPGGYCQVSVSFDPTTVGSTSATLAITSTDAGSPHNITLAGAGSAGTSYYFSPNGSDSNSGSLSSPWLSPNNHNGAQGAGVRFILRGGRYVFSYSVSGSTSATTALPMVLASYPGERAVLESAYTGNGIFVSQYGPMIFDGITFERGFMSVILDLNGSPVMVLSNTFSEFGGQPIRSNTVSGSTAQWQDGVKIQGNYFDSMGTPTASDGSGGFNDGIVLSAPHHVLTANNYVSRIGHYFEDVLGQSGLRAQFVIARDNTVDQYWGGAFAEINSGVTWPGRVIEHNRLAHVGWGVIFTKTFFEVQGSDTLVRFNVASDQAGNNSDNAEDIFAQSNGGTSTVSGDRDYNNTFYHIGGLTWLFGQAHCYGCVQNGVTTSILLTNSKILNDITYLSNQSASIWGDVPWPLNVLTEEGDSGGQWTANTMPGSTVGNYIYSNLMDNSTSNPVARYVATLSATGSNNFTIDLPGTNGGNTTAPQASGTSSANYHVYNWYQANPAFANPVTALLLQGFALQAGSPAIAQGAHLAFVTASGAGNQVPVSDIYAFNDGMGLIEGDVVKIGRNFTAKVLRADAQSGTITVAPPVVFFNGDSVDLAVFKGAAPDLGAVPYIPTAPVISAVAASMSNATSGSISWTTSVAATSQCEWGITTTYGLTSLESGSLSTAHSCRLSGLWPGTTYHYAVISKDSNGGLAVSADATFTTPAEPGPVISNVRMSAVSVVSGNPSTATVTISWTTSTAATSQVLYSKASNSPNVSYTFETTTSVADTSGVTSHTVTISGLTLNYAYHFSVQSMDVSSGTINYSPEGEFVTPNTTTTPLLSNVTVSSTNNVTNLFGSSTGCWSDGNPDNGYGGATQVQCGYSNAQATIGWTANESVSSPRVLLVTSAVGQNSQSQYHTFPNTPINYQYWQIASFDNYTMPTTGGSASATTNPSLTIYEQAPCTKYYFTVQSTDTNNNTNSSYAMEFPQACLDTPSNLTPYPPQTYMTETATGISSSGATITWTSDQATTAYVEYGTSSAYSNTSTISSSSISHSVTISGLTTSTTYHYAIVQTNSAGMTFTGPDQTFTTH